MKQIDMTKTKALAESKDAVLVDIRDPVRYRDYHVEGSTFFHLRNVSLLSKYANDKRPFVLIYEAQDEQTLASFSNYMIQFNIDPKRIHSLKLD